jgi:Fe-S-cluster containining protein
MQCNQCSACCIEISISSPIPGMPNGKAAGERCLHLVGNLCGIFGQPDRPAVCSSFKASQDICGNNYSDAVRLIRWYEKETSP